MNATFNIQSGPDGKLHFDIPVDQPDAEYQVEVLVRLAPVSAQEAYLDFLRRTAGAWQGEFERPPQSPPEERDSFS
jgi:hypothetical protein